MNRALFLLMIAMMLIGPAVGTAYGAAYYVSPQGNDSWAGTLPSPNGAGNGPFLTIQHAIAAMETSSIKTTYVRQGEYFLNNGNGSCLTLNSNDSGIQLLAYPGEFPILSGGFQVTNWRQEPSISGAWSAPFPPNFSVGSVPAMPPVVTVNGQWFDCARTPNVSPTSRYLSGFCFVNTATPNSQGQYYTFTVRNTDINPQNYNGEPTAGVDIWSYNGWGCDPLPISSVNFNTSPTATVNLTNYSAFGLGSNSRYFLYGTKGSLDVPGEFYEDTANSRLWIIPPSGVNPNSATVVISPVDGPAVIDINGANHVLISGFQIRDQHNSARWGVAQNGGVRIDNGDTDIVQNCIISCTGIGVDLESAATDCLILGNEIFDTVAGGINLGGTNTLANNRAIGNYIHDIGLIEQGARAINSAPAPNDIGYNLIMNVPDKAIICGDGATASNGLTIEYNSIIHSSQGANDTGAIYLKNGGVYNANAPEIVRYNLIDDTGGAGFDSNENLYYPNLSFGAYLDQINDQGQSGTQIYGNLFNQSGQGGVFPHNGQNNNIYNNILANSNGYQLWMESNNNPSTNVLTRNLFYYGVGIDPLKLFFNAPLTATEQSTLSDNIYWNWNTAYSGHNSASAPFVDYYNAGGTELTAANGFPQYPQSFSSWQATGNGSSPPVLEDAGSLQTDPLFVNPANFNFQLQSNSPAFSLGFQQLPFGQMGPQGYAPASLQINCSGGATGTWAADEDYSGGNWTGYADTINTSATNAAPAVIYQSQRYGTFTYTIPNLAPGSAHLVRLHFAELWYGVSGRGGSAGAGRRFFNVSINNTTVLSNFDVYATAGGPDIADVEQFTALADSNGRITISFAPSTGSPDQNTICNGIEIDPPSPQPIVQINCSGGATGTWAADEDYSGGNWTGYADTISTNEALHPAPAAIYQSQRYGTFTYTIPNLTPGSAHLVRLHFAELWYGVSGRGGSSGAGRRFFNVTINGTQALSNFDVYATAGNADIAVVRPFVATANSSGQIVISFAPSTGSPDQNTICNGIEVY